MDDRQLELIEARTVLATSGPWTAISDVFGSDPLHRIQLASGAVLSPACNFDLAHATAERPEDVEFMAHARTDVPALVAEVRRLQVEIKKCHDALRDRQSKG